MNNKGKMEKKIKIRNLTPHQIDVVDDKGEVIQTFPSEGSTRLSSSTVREGSLGGIPLSKTFFGETEGLPEKREGVFYIVSSLICQANPGRDDLLIVNETVRDENGRINGCKSLSLNPNFGGKQK